MVWIWLFCPFDKWGNWSSNSGSALPKVPYKVTGPRSPNFKASSPKTSGCLTGVLSWQISQRSSWYGHPIVRLFPKAVYHMINFKGFNLYLPEGSVITSRPSKEYIERVYWTDLHGQKNWVPIIKKYLALWRQKCYIRIIIQTACKYLSILQSSEAPNSNPISWTEWELGKYFGFDLQSILGTLSALWSYFWGNFFYYMCA